MITKNDCLTVLVALEDKGINFTYAKKHYKYPVITYKYSKTPELFLALAEYYKNEHFDEVYYSPLPRAKITANALLKDRDVQSFEVEWLEEFHHHVNIPGCENKVLNWDFKPNFFVNNEEFYNNELYFQQ